MTDFNDPEQLYKRLKEAEAQCSENADRCRANAHALTEAAKSIRSTSIRYVDPEDFDGGKKGPALLEPMISEYRDQVDYIERVALSQYAQAGVWDNEADIHLQQIETIARDLGKEPDGAA